MIKLVWETIKARIARKERLIKGGARRGRIFEKIDPSEEGPRGHNTRGKGKLSLKAKITRVDGTVEEITLA